MSTLPLVLAAFLAHGSPEIRDRTLELDDGTALRYAVSVPAGGAETPRPLVLALHFGWQGERPRAYGRMFLELLVAPALARLDAILVAPDAPEASWTHPRSEKALLALVDSLKRSHPVDPERIVVAGFSLGAMGAWYLAARHPEIWSAAIAMAGPPVLGPIADARAGLEESKRLFGDRPEGAEIDWPPALLETPILVIHSRADELVPFPLVLRAVRSLRAAGGRVEFLKVNDLGHFQTPGYVEYLARTVRWLRRDVWAG